jgi:hypothetical protein
MRTLLYGSASVVVTASGGGTGGGLATVGVGVVASGSGTGSGTATLTAGAVGSGGGTGSGVAFATPGVVASGGGTAGGGATVGVNLKGSGGGTGSGSATVGVGGIALVGVGGGTGSGTATVSVGLIGTGSGLGSGVAIVSAGAQPYDLAEAIAARFAAAAALSGSGGFAAIYESAAVGTPVTPYLVYTITSAGLETVYSDSQWDDHRVKFEVFADTQDAANKLRDAVAATTGYGGQSLAFSSGLMTPFVRVDRSEARERGRVPGSKLAFKAFCLFQSRVRSNF